MRRDPGDMAEAAIPEETADAREAQSLIEEMYREEERRMAAPEAVAALLDQLVAAGHTPEQAKLQTALLEHRANTWARRIGRSAGEWFQRKGIRFERHAAPDGAGDYAQAAMYRNRLPLVDFVEQAAGEPSAKDSWVEIGAR